MNISFTTYDNHSGICKIIGNKEGKTIVTRAERYSLPLHNSKYIMDDSVLYKEC